MHSFEIETYSDEHKQVVLTRVFHHGDFSGDIEITMEKLERKWNAEKQNYEIVYLGNFRIPSKVCFELAGRACRSTLVAALEQVNFTALFRGEWRKVLLR